MADDQRTESMLSSSPRNTDRKERDLPPGNERRRSRSPRRDRDGDSDRPKRRKDAGFKWKEKRRDEEPRREQRDSGLQRGYKDHYRPRSRSPRPRSPRREDKREDAKAPEPEKQQRKEKKEKKQPTPVGPQEAMIIVYVNDRLGTKKAVPCFASDPIKDFKVIVASMVGRQPHEILLKRQGERPFKDQLTLQDYGVSNNVQLDLEVDTGD